MRSLKNAALVLGTALLASMPPAGAAERPVVDLRTWPMPDTDLSKLPDTAQNRLIQFG